MDHVIGKTPVIVNSLHVAADEILHVVQGFLDVILPGEFFALLKDRLNGFRASASAGAMHSIATSSMVRAQLATGNVEHRITHRPAQRRLHDIDRRPDEQRGVLRFQEVDERFAFGRHLLAQVKESVIAIEPDRIVIRTGHSTPDLSFGFSERKGGFHLRFIQLGFPSRREGPFPIDPHVLLQVGRARGFFVPDAGSCQRSQIDALPGVVKIDRLDETFSLRPVPQRQPHRQPFLWPGHHQLGVFT